MDNQPTTTLSQFFSLTKETCHEKLAGIGTEGDADLTTKLEKAGGIKWSLASEQIGEHLSDMLDIPIHRVIGNAWGKSSSLLKYCDMKPDESCLLPVGKHTIKSEHHPALEIHISGRQVGKLEFTVELSLLLEGLVLKLHDSRIKKMHIGKCSGNGTISYKNVVILEKKSPDMSLAESYDFGEGIAIIPADNTIKMQN
jgi:hypothetical protein